MGSHRRKWGWWLVAAIAVAVAASLFLHRRPAAPAFDDESVPVVRERKVETRERAGEAPAVVETVVTVPLKDVNSLLREKSGRDIILTTKAPDRFTLTYAGKVDIPMIGEQDMNFSADFKVVEVKGDRLVVQLDSGAALNAAADLLAPRIMERLPEGLVDSFSNGRAVINLSAVPQLKKKLNGVEIVGFSLDQEAISLRTVKK